MFNPASVDFWVLLSFLMFMALIIYLGVPGTIGKALDARAEGIKKELDEARRLREEAQKLLADYQRKAREAESEAKGIVDAAKREAEQLAAETRKSMAEQLERRTKAAEEKIARAEAQALGEVRATAVDAAVAAAERVIGQRVSGDAANRLADDAIRGLKGQLN